MRRGPVLGLSALGGALVAVAALPGWVRGRIDDPVLGHRAVEAAGQSVAPAILAFALVVLAAVSTFLVAMAVPALTAGPGQLQLGRDSGFWAYVAPFAFGTVWAATIAMAIAVPTSIGIALFLTHYAPRRLSALFGYIIDLLAAVPRL